ncbi:hypothetical protein ACRAWD_20750 [Caulobacter segnis]
MVSLPEGGTSFTTIELKSNFLGTARDGGVAVEAKLAHSGTQHPGSGTLS